MKSFEELPLRQEILRGIFGYGFEKPSVIQQLAIPPILTGGDVIAQAQSGTGKTATFSIAVLQQIREDVPEVQALLLAPTRELALQTFKVITTLGQYLKMKAYACIGGTSVGESARQLRELCPQVVVGTPGRVIDLIGRGALRPQTIRTLVIDEADVMLSKGFKDQMHQIFNSLRHDVQAVLLSATLPPEILEMSSKFMRDPQRILVPPEQLSLRGLSQFYVALEQESMKLDTLCDLYDSMSVAQTVIFCNKAQKVDQLTAAMRERQFAVSSIHGAMEQNVRDDIMHQFRTGQTRVLITTDLLARGIDVQQVALVINYDVPNDKENYLHRVGRGARFGRKGVAINFVLPADVQMMRTVQSFYEIEIDELPSDFVNLIS